MSDANHNNYIKAISKTSNRSRHNKDDVISISLDKQSVKLIKEIKDFMEWDLDTALNSSITYFYKTDEFNDLNDKDIINIGVKEVKFTPTFKNRQRILKDIDRKKLSKKYYIVLIHFAVESFFKTIHSKH